MKNLFHILLSAFTLMSSTAGAETTANTWFILNHDVDLSESWNMHFDATARQTADIFDHRQHVFRAAVHKDISSAVKVGFGYVYQGTENWNALIETPSDEHRLYEQFDISQDWSDIGVNHRIRFEQRFRESRNADRESYQNRWRYQLKGRKSLSETRDFIFSEELFVHKGDGTPTLYSQNRVFLGLGFTGGRLAKSRVELGWLWQDNARGSSTPHFTVHALQLALYGP